MEGKRTGRELEEEPEGKIKFSAPTERPANIAAFGYRVLTTKTILEFIHCAKKKETRSEFIADMANEGEVVTDQQLDEITEAGFLMPSKHLVLTAKGVYEAESTPFGNTVPEWEAILEVLNTSPNGMKTIGGIIRHAQNIGLDVTEDGIQQAIKRRLLNCFDLDGTPNPQGKYLKAA
jgi:hypothetical protein